MVTDEKEMERADYERELAERKEYEEQIDVGAMAEQEAEAQYEYEKEIKDYPLKVIINAIIEQQEKGQISPQTISDLKLLLGSIEIERRL